MYDLNDEGFPIVIQTVDEQPLTVNDIHQFEAKLASLCTRGERFGILAVVGNDHAEKTDKAVTKASNDMFKRLKPSLSRWCVGFAGVTASSKWLALYRPIADLAMRNRLGCPGAVFEREHEAELWLRERLRKVQSA